MVHWSRTPCSPLTGSGGGGRLTASVLYPPVTMRTRGQKRHIDPERRAVLRRRARSLEEAARDGRRRSVGWSTRACATGRCTWSAGARRWVATTSTRSARPRRATRCEIHVDATGEELSIPLRRGVDLLARVGHGRGRRAAPRPPRALRDDHGRGDVGRRGARRDRVGRPGRDRARRRRRMAHPGHQGAGRAHPDAHRRRASRASRCLSTPKRAPRSSPSARSESSSGLWSTTRSPWRGRDDTVPLGHEAHHPDPVPQRGGPAPHLAPGPASRAYPASSRSSG